MTSVRDVSGMGKNLQGAWRDPQRRPTRCRGGETEVQGRAGPGQGFAVSLGQSPCPARAPSTARSCLRTVADVGFCVQKQVVSQNPALGTVGLSLPGPLSLTLDRPGAPAAWALPAAEPPPS